jgi:hypothetical protein
MAEETKQVTVSLPADLAAAAESAAAVSERSLAGEIRVALKAHLGSVVANAPTETPSGFSRSAAEDLGVVFVVDRPGHVLAEWRRDGASQAWGPGPLFKVLSAIEAWHVTRVSMGATAPAPVAIVPPAPKARPSGRVAA